jgi:hypothetical protein
VDPFLRRRRSVLIVSIGAAAGVLAVACAARPPALVGTSDRRTPGRTVLAPDGGFVDGASELPPSYRTTFSKVNKGRFVSQGHAAGRWDVDVWANEPAERALASRARETPVGAIVVEEHYERARDVASAPDASANGPIMVMEKMAPGFSKDHGDWRYVVVGSQGQLVKSGVIESCAGCHDDAPMDGFFPIVE